MNQYREWLLVSLRLGDDMATRNMAAQQEIQRLKGLVPTPTSHGCS